MQQSNSAAVGTVVVAAPAAVAVRRRTCSSSGSSAVHHHRRRMVASRSVESNTRSNEADGASFDGTLQYYHSSISTPRTRDRFFHATMQCQRLLYRLS